MAEELLINVNPFETRVAMVAHGLLQEIHLARAAGYSITGNIYLGRVERIVPGMQAAFVDIGLARPGFLHARDMDRSRIMDTDQADGTNNANNANDANNANNANNKSQTRPRQDIREMLHDGQAVMVQVEKDPISSKGARLSTQLALASKYLVLMPNEHHVGISQRIDEEDERARLRDILVAIKEQLGLTCGVIARTASEGAEADRLRSDLKLLQRIWQRIQTRVADQRAANKKAPYRLFEELPLHTRIIRDLAGPETEKILIDDDATYQRVRSYVEEFIPGYAERLHAYHEPRPLFARHGVEDEVSRALQPRLVLKCGGSLVIEQTEAMISIDVNTGGFVGGHSLEETVFRANMEAAAAIPRQLRLRNLGGIIVIDFIDMEDEEHRRQVLRTLEKAVELDPARTRLEGFSSLGLVQMSRKRTRQSLAQSMCAPCVNCTGVGLVRTAESTSIAVLRALSQDFQVRCRHKEVAGDYLIRATESVVDRLLDEDAEHLAELSTHMQRKIRIQLEPSYLEGQFDIALVQNLAR